MDKESYVSIFVKDICVAVRVGLLDAEKKGPQALSVSIELYAGAGYLEKAIKGQILDYSLFYDFIVAWELRDHVELLEPLAQDLIAFAFGFDDVQAVRVSLAKPDIFDKAAQAGIEVFVSRDAF